MSGVISAEMAMTGAEKPLALRRRMASKPSITGILRSISISSGSICAAASSASLPVAETVTVNPADSKARRAISAFMGLSSAISTLPAPDPVSGSSATSRPLRANTIRSAIDDMRSGRTSQPRQPSCRNRPMAPRSSGRSTTSAGALRASAETVASGKSAPTMRTSMPGGTVAVDRSIWNTSVPRPDMLAARASVVAAGRPARPIRPESRAGSCASGASLGRSGTSTENVAPSPGCESTVTMPPSRSTSRLTIASPRPTPPSR